MRRQPMNADRISPGTKVLAAGRYLMLLDENGWEYVTRPGVSGVVIIVAVTPDGRLLLVEQRRVPVHQRVIELPAGIAGDAAERRGESLIEAAERELREETGYAAERMERLAEGPAAVGVSDEVVTFFAARGLSRVGPGGGDDSEDITVHEVPLGELRSFLSEKQRAGLAVDPKIYAGLYLLEAGVTG
jgi:ADP-ribose pyrophosphatase